MKVAAGLVVGIAYQLKNEDGVVLEEYSIDQPQHYLHGHDGIIPALETALDGRGVGEQIEVTVAPSDGYGEYSEELVQRVPKDVFNGEELEVGMRFMVDTDQGQIPVEITAVEDDHVVVDGNDMLAGQVLHFQIQIVDIRAATDEELTHGHVHGTDGHDHEHVHDEHCNH